MTGHIHTGAPQDPQRYLVRQGGLMRCCLLTLASEPSSVTVAAKEGMVLPCAFCSSTMVFTQGAWEWNKARRDYTSPPLYRQAP